MKKIYFLLYFILINIGVFTSQLKAQSPTYYNYNTNSPSNSFPWATTAGKETQYLVTAGTLIGAPSGYNISTVYFQVTASQSCTWTNLTIKLGQTSLTAMPASIYTGSLTTCYSASSVAGTSNSSGWLSFTLQTPFFYDPSLGLIVDVSQCGATNTTMITTNHATSSYTRNYINASSCSFTYSGQDMNVFNFGVDLSAAVPPGPTVPPTAGYAYNISIDTAWLNNPYIFVNTSTNSMRSYWDIIGYSSTLNGTYSAFTPPSTNPRVCATRWNFCYIDTVSNNFSWKFTQAGYYKVKLKCTNNYGSDSIYKIVICSPPTRKPVASFFSLNRSVGFTDQLNYYDLSTNGPTSWRWFLNPTYYGVNTFAGYPIANSWYATDSVQNPYLYAFDGGIFDVCLAAGNALGWDTICRHNYLNVNNGYMMCNGSDSVSFLTSGYVYDAGGPTSNYTGATTGSCPAGFRIAACADSIILDIERFKLIAGDSLTIRVGTPTGAIIKRLGGQTLHDSLRHYKVPGGFVFFQMNAAPASVGDSGFAIHWGIVPASYGKPKASFTMTTNGPTTNGIPSIYRGYTIQYSSTSSGLNMSYSWDTDGNGIYGTSIGGDSINQNPSWATTAGTTVGLYNVCLRVSNCVGTDSVCKQIRVLPVPSRPTADMTVNRNSGFTTDTFRFYDNSINGAMTWLWTFNPANVAYLNNTTATSQNPIVFLNSAICYTVTLRACNSLGCDTKIIPCMVNVVGYNSPGTAYPIPAGSDIGISRVRLGSIDTTTALQTPVYTQMNDRQKTTLYKGVDYTLTTFRLTNNDPMTTRVWIDYNMNSYFTDTLETIIDEMSQFKISTSKTFRVPDNNMTGNTRMRVGITYDSTTLRPDWASLGCFEDYGINIGVDYVKPVLALIGPAVYKMEIGKTYTEFGVTAFDNLEGNIGSRVLRTGYLDVNTLGYYTLTYTVADLYGNISLPITRIVQVGINQTGPTIALVGNSIVSVGVKYNYTEQGATAADNVGRNISNLITITGSVNTNLLGSYPIKYKIIDAFGFTDSVIRTVLVVDTTKPVISSIINGRTGTDTVRYQIGTSFVAQNVVRVIDNYWTNLTLNQTGTINVNVKGYYTLLFNSTDGSGNQANSFRLVVKIDNTIFPTVTLIGDADMIVDVNTTFTDPGTNASSSYYSFGSLVLNTTTNLDMTKLGNYTINYCVSDPSNNVTCVTRIVHVVDRIAPVISLLGEDPFVIYRYNKFVDPGVIISDNYYTESQLQPMLKADYSKVKNDVPGIYYVSFNLTDPSGNIAKEVLRTVIVRAKIGGINSISTTEKIKIYPNPSNGKFIIDNENGTSIQSIKVYAIIGSLVKEITVTGTNKTIEVDLTGINEGMYIVKLEGAGKTFTQKINIIK